MSGKQNTETPVVQLVEAPTTTPKIDLRNAAAIRREMAQVYRDMRAGKMETQDGTRLAYVLTQLGKMYELQVIEERLQTLEEASNEH